MSYFCDPKTYGVSCNHDLAENILSAAENLYESTHFRFYSLVILFLGTKSKFIANYYITNL